MSEQREEIIRPPQDIKPSGVGGGGWKELAKMALPAILVGIILYVAVLPQYTTLKESDKRVNSMITTITALSDRLKGDEGTIATLSTQVTSATKQMQDVQSSLNNIQTVVNGYKSQLSNLPSQSDMTTMQTTLTALSGKVDALPDSIKKDYTAQIKVIQDKLDNVYIPSTITGFTPASGAAGMPVVITGTKFSGVTSVTFGGNPASSYTIDSVTQITAYVGNGNDGAIGITTSAGTVFSNTSFDYTGTTTTTVGVVVMFSPKDLSVTLPNDFNVTIVNNTDKDIIGGQFSVKIQYAGLPSSTDPVTLDSSYITWQTTVSVQGTYLTRIGAGSLASVYIQKGNSLIIPVTMNPPVSSTTTLFKVVDVQFIPNFF